MRIVHISYKDENFTKLRYIENLVKFEKLGLYVYVILGNVLENNLVLFSKLDTHRYLKAKTYLKLDKQYLEDGYYGMIVTDTRLQTVPKTVTSSTRFEGVTHPFIGCLAKYSREYDEDLYSDFGCAVKEVLGNISSMKSISSKSKEYLETCVKVPSSHLSKDLYGIIKNMEYDTLNLEQCEYGEERLTKWFNELEKYSAFYTYYLYTDDCLTIYWGILEKIR